MAVIRGTRAPAAVSDPAIIQPGNAYYCGALQAYDPSVETCPEPWTMVAPPED